MTQEEIEVIINSDIPSKQKSELIIDLLSKKNESVKVCKKGGKTTFEEWYKTVPEDRSDTIYYDLKSAYENYPEDMLENWRTSSVEDLRNGKNHLGSVIKL